MQKILTYFVTFVAQTTHRMSNTPRVFAPQRLVSENFYAYSITKGPISLIGVRMNQVVTIHI